MKSTLFPFFLIIFSLITFACNECKEKPWQVAGVNVIYQNNPASDVMYAIRTKPNDLSYKFDTIAGIASGSSDQPLVFFLEVDEKYSYIIYLEDTQTQDTITDIIIGRDKCDELTGISYKLNKKQQAGYDIFIK